MDHHTTAYQPVRSSNPSKDEDYCDGAIIVDQKSLDALYSSKSRMRHLVIVLGAFLVVSNVIWIKQWISLRSQTLRLLPSYYNAGPPSLKPFLWDTPFSKGNESVGTKLWDELIPLGKGYVSVSKTWALEKQLSKTMDDPKNAENSIYFADTFHRMHCLILLRDALLTLHHPDNHTEQEIPWTHAFHCLDGLRQSLMCNLDDTLLSLRVNETFTNGFQVLLPDYQSHFCPKDFDAFRDWVGLHAYEEMNHWQ